MASYIWSSLNPAALPLMKYCSAFSYWAATPAADICARAERTAVFGGWAVCGGSAACTVSKRPRHTNRRIVSTRYENFSTAPPLLLVAVSAGIEGVVKALGCNEKNTRETGSG